MEIKERLLKGAQELFMRYGIKTMTMDDIAKHLGVSKKTIYQHVKDKNELVNEVMSSHMECEKLMFDEITSKSSNAIEELIHILKHLKITLMNINPSLILDLQKYYPMAWKYFQEHKSECVRYSIKNNLDWGKREGYYRADINAEILARARMEQIETGMNPVVFPTVDFSVLEVQMELLNHFIMGIVTAKGLELYNKKLNNNE